VDELAWMLGFEANPSPDQVQQMAKMCLDLGCGLVGIKLGEDGIFAAAGEEPARLDRLVPGWARWQGERLGQPSLEVETVGTTGAGDTAIAGFIAAMVNGETFPAALEMAAASAACSVQGRDGVGGVRSYEAAAELARHCPRRGQ
jgi:sugar/nucleoside kinase (ribokinase family)